jgi:hypothetical protein
MDIDHGAFFKNDDTAEKENVGKLWAEKSGNLFLRGFRKDDRGRDISQPTQPSATRAEPSDCPLLLPFSKTMRVSPTTPSCTIPARAAPVTPVTSGLLVSYGSATCGHVADGGRKYTRAHRGDGPPPCARPRPAPSAEQADACSSWQGRARTGLNF